MILEKPQGGGSWPGWAASSFPDILITSLSGAIVARRPFSRTTTTATTWNSWSSSPNRPKPRFGLIAKCQTMFVHLVMVPKHEDGLRATLGEVHRLTRGTSTFATDGGAIYGWSGFILSSWMSSISWKRFGTVNVIPSRPGYDVTPLTGVGRAHLPT